MNPIEAGQEIQKLKDRTKNISDVEQFKTASEYIQANVNPSAAAGLSSSSRVRPQQLNMVMQQKIQNPMEIKR